MSANGHGPPTGPGDEWTFVVDDNTPQLLARVRRWTATALADLGDDHLNDVMLILVELVSNAYEHGGGCRSVRLARSRTPCRIDVEVDDNNADQLTPGVSRFGTKANRGRGLIMIDKIAESWGVRNADGVGKTVWAHISCENATPCPA
ncbi:ATP-binding protein [Actinophytocola sp. KF-1]